MSDLQGKDKIESQAEHFISQTSQKDGSCQEPKILFSE